MRVQNTQAQPNFKATVIRIKGLTPKNAAKITKLANSDIKPPQELEKLADLADLAKKFPLTKDVKISQLAKLKDKSLIEKITQLAVAVGISSAEELKTVTKLAQDAKKAGIVRISQLVKFAQITKIAEAIKHSLKNPVQILPGETFLRGPVLCLNTKSGSEAENTAIQALKASLAEIQGVKVHSVEDKTAQGFAERFINSHGKESDLADLIKFRPEKANAPKAKKKALLKA